MSDKLDARGLPTGYPLKPDYEVSPRDAHAALTRRDTLFLDVRTPSEHEIARIPGSVLIPLHELETRLDELGDHKVSPIVVYCHHGVRSLRATLLMGAHGFTHARSMAGGLDLWSQAVDPSMPRYERHGAICRVVSPR